jgi:hypothetical protein
VSRARAPLVPLVPLVLLVLLAPAAGLAAQDEKLSAVQDLRSPDAERAAAARRRLWFAPAVSLPADALHAALADPDPRVARAAAELLLHHGVADDRLRALLARGEPELRIVALPRAEDDEVRALLDDAEDPELRIAALYELEDRGRLEGRELAAAIGGDAEELARAALEIALCERAPFPVALVDDLDARGRQRMVESLAERPRRATRPWLELLLEGSELPAGTRLLAIAALPPEAIDLPLAKEVVVAAAQPETTNAAHTAALRFPSAVADALVGFAHARLERGDPVQAILPCLHRVSALGERQVLALAQVLPAATVEEICAWLAGRDSLAGLREQSAAALDGAIPLAPHLLRRAGPQIDTPARIERVTAVLTGSDAALRPLAFHALIAGGVFVPEMLEHARAPGLGQGSDAATPWSSRAQRVRDLLRLPPAVLPDDVLRELLADEDPSVVVHACRALERAPLPAALEPDVLACAHRVGEVRDIASRVLLARGSRAIVQEWWDAASDDERTAAVPWLYSRAEPWVAELLARERARVAAGGDAASADLRQELALGAALLGDRDAVAWLLDALPRLRIDLLRRCAPALTRALSAADVERLRPHVLGPQRLPDAAREEVVRWLAARPDLDVAPLLREVHRADDAMEIRAAALGGLLLGPDAEELHGRLRAAMARPLTEDDRELAFEILGSARHPLRPLDLETVARLVLVAPLADPELAANDAARDLVHGGEYPFHAPVVDLLRREEEPDVTAFARVADDLARDPRRYRLSGRCLGHLLREVARVPRLREALAPLLARLLLTTPDADPRMAGIAHLVLGEAAERAERHGEAADHFGRAARALLRSRLPPLLERAILGPDGSAGGALIAAALSARGPLAQARAALARGDAAAARTALAAARELAEGDARSEREVAALQDRIDK